MTSKVYKMRPHHIKLLCCLISAGCADGSDAESYIRRHNPVGQCDIYYNNSEGVPDEYSDEFVNHLVDYYSKLLGDGEAHLEVVDGIDDICQLGPNGCERRRASCECGDLKKFKCYIYENSVLKVGNKRKVSRIIKDVVRIWYRNREIINRLNGIV